MSRVSKISIVLLFPVLLTMALVGEAVSATPFLEYSEAVKKASSDVRPLTEADLDFKLEETRNAATVVLKSAEKSLSEFDLVTYGDYEIPVDNSWLKRYVSNYINEETPEKKKLIVNAISERLDSIATDVILLTGSSTRTLTKDEEKKRLAEILSREEYLPADAASEGILARIMRSILEWLNRNSPDGPDNAPSGTADLSVLKTGLQVLILGLAVALLIFVAYRYGPALIGKRKRKKKKRKNQLILGEEIDKDATTADLFSAAEALAADGDVRGAIRKGYISLLFELSQRKLIGLAKHKTNRDYLRDLARHEPVRKQVGGLTVNYERHWYGNADASENDWDEFKTEYTETLKR